MTTFLAKNPIQTHFNILNIPKPKPFKKPVICVAAALPARDTVIDFGKYKGRMLGTLPSTYLKWVSTNLRARDFEEWAHRADEVLEDPVYNDRVEWEHAERLLSGNGLVASSMSVGAVAELVEISRRFGWDNDDKVGWSQIDFEKLGTSKGGRIPRVNEKSKSGATLNNAAPNPDRKNVGKVSASVSETRIERRERLRTRRSVTNVSKNERSYNVGVKNDERKGGVGSRDGGDPDVYNPFPGRETLLKKVLNHKKIR